MIFVVGEILFDIFPEFRRTGGAPFNFAYHLIQMGFAVKFITRVGADPDGDQLLAFMQRSGFDQEYIQVDDKHKTGSVIVSPDQAGGHRFDILRDAAYDYIAFTDAVGQLLEIPPRLIYFGTLVQRTAVGRQTIKNICRARSPETKVFYDINLRPDCYTRDIIQQSLRNTDILKLNDEELDVLAGMFNLTGDTALKVKQLIRDFSLTMVALTKGARGSEVFTDAGHIAVPLSHEYECVDTVGAGDAFAAVMASGYLKNRDLREVVPAATAFAGRICGIPGAIPDDKRFYNPIIL